MAGQGQIMYLLSKACRNEPFSSEEVSSGNLPRHNIIPLLDASYKPGPELAHQVVASPSRPLSENTRGQTAPEPSPPPNCTWTYFTFPPTSLAALKSLATKTIPVPSSHISTDDTLSAFMWQSITRARLPRLNPTSKSTFARSVDVRHFLNIPPTYPGLMHNMTSARTRFTSWLQSH
ncbi:trichothecene 3-O-acetyltransferase protein [Rutstroemia sp. NJR-2017a BVV2]|nr:trichothecene 3-O-acetyltransferase protein [Rutstroemia sp. NJR-2017a BVV2]